MDLTHIYHQFIEGLTISPEVNEAKMVKIAGIPFFYITSDSPYADVEKVIHFSAQSAITGKLLHYESIFVRSENNLYVYRHRFYVPQKKMFCCGNQCVDCIRFN